MPPLDYRYNIRKSGLTIYSEIKVREPGIWIPTDVLEKILDKGLRGVSLKGLPLRTRSKVVKQKVCEILGYPVPATFKKSQPRFPGQLFDTYIQKSNNLQIWNEEIFPTRRYVIIKVSTDDVIQCVKIITGDILASFDKTGTLTQKYQARLIPSAQKEELIADVDMDNLRPFLIKDAYPSKFNNVPTDYPAQGGVLPIAEIFKRLKTLLGSKIADSGYDQERNRGAQLHRVICSKLGYKIYRDDGSFPDIKNQLLEVKLQTSPTIDLGLIKPDSTEILDMPQIYGRELRHCDVRYALFYAITDGEWVELTHLYLTTGNAFFSRFPQFQGRIVNRKLQIPLPRDFFSS